MKKSLITLIIMALFTSAAFAQKYKNGAVSMYNAKGRKYGEIYHKLQFGVLFPGSIPARTNAWYTKKRNLVTDGELDMFPLTLRYAWSSNPNTEFIIQGDFERTRYFDALYTQSVTHHRNFYTLSVGMNYKWWQKRLFTVYSGLMLGGGYGHYSIKNQEVTPYEPEKVDQKNWFYPSAQLTAIGINWGKKFGGFAELAFGSKGVLNAGFYWKL